MGADINLGIAEGDAEGEIAGGESTQSGEQLGGGDVVDNVGNDHNEGAATLLFENGGDGSEIVWFEQFGLNPAYPIEDSRKVVLPLLRWDPSSQISIKYTDTDSISPLNGGEGEGEGGIQAKIEPLVALNIGGHQTTTIE